jgi:hypothetical protein
MKKAKYIQTVSVLDPDSLASVDVSIYKDLESHGLFGIDSSYILTLSDNDPVKNPFNGNELQLIGD